MPHSSGISNILGSPAPSRYNFHNFMQWKASMKGDTCHTHFLASVTLCNLGEGFHNLVTYLSVMTLNPALQGWDSWDGAWPLWITLAGAFVCCSFLEAENSLSHSLYNLEAYRGRVSWGYLFLYSNTDLNLINRTNLSTFNKPSLWQQAHQCSLHLQTVHLVFLFASFSYPTPGTNFCISYFSMLG